MDKPRLQLHGDNKRDTLPVGAISPVSLNRVADARNIDRNRATHIEISTINATDPELVTKGALQHIDLHMNTTGSDVPGPIGGVHVNEIGSGSRTKETGIGTPSKSKVDPEMAKML